MSEENLSVEQTVEMDDNALEEAFNDAIGVESEVDETPEEEGAEETQAQESEPEAKDELTQLREEFEALKRERENQKYLIDKQGNELGELRKVKEEVKKLKDPNQFLNEFADKPIDAVNNLVEEKLALLQEQQRRQQETISTSKDTINKLIPGFDSKIDAIKEFYKEKGASAEFVNSLSANSFYNPQTIDLAVALGEIANLKSLLSTTKSKGQDVLNKINKGSASIRSSVGSSALTDSTTNVPLNPTKMSDKQLAEALKKLTA